MKKKYFTPEMEEVSVNEPVVLDLTESSGGSLSGCPDKECESDSCKSNFE